MKLQLQNVAEVFSRSWYTWDNGTYGSGAKCCRSCTANSYNPEHLPSCIVAKAAEELKAAGYNVDVSLKR